MRKIDYRAIRSGIAGISSDVSNDAIGRYAPKIEDMFAPERHAIALSPSTPIVVGSRGTGKSFWAGMLGQEPALKAVAKAYPTLKLNKVRAEFGYTGISGESGIGVDALAACLGADATPEQAKAFWWGTILRATGRATAGTTLRLGEAMKLASDWEERERILSEHDRQLRSRGEILLILFDALDTVASTWPRRRLLTEALFEVVWAMRAYFQIRLKLFVRPDQIDDDTLRFVELPKLRTGAVRLAWSGADLYGLLFSRMALSQDLNAKREFSRLLKTHDLPTADLNSILTRSWPLCDDQDMQSKAMNELAGTYMSSGPNGYKKGKTYDWPIKHLADAHDEVTPRSFLGLMIAAAKHGTPPLELVITPDGIRHGLREASRTRVDQLHQEFPWIKGVLAPLAGLLLPQEEEAVFAAWKATKTIRKLTEDADRESYLPPFEAVSKSQERSLLDALERIGVMFRRKDSRIDMPDLFRVAAKLLKKGGTAPL